MMHKIVFQLTTILLSCRIFFNDWMKQYSYFIAVDYFLHWWSSICFYWHFPEKYSKIKKIIIDWGKICYKMSGYKSLKQLTNLSVHVGMAFIELWIYFIDQDLKKKRKKEKEINFRLEKCLRRECVSVFDAFLKIDNKLNFKKRKKTWK